MHGDEGQLHSGENERIAARLREELARRRISRQALADMARISLSTLEKALSGSRPFSLATVIRIEDVLGTALRSDSAVPTAQPELALSPGHMGSYGRPAVRWIEGAYLTLRPSFSKEGAIYSYCTQIFWDSKGAHLGFSESERVDRPFTQTGFVAMPNLSGHTYLVTSEEGQYRLVILGRATRERRMFGLLSTLQAGPGSQLFPVACPIAMVPLEQVDTLHFGVIAAEHEGYDPYRRILDEALASDFCRWYA